ncbi:MAG: phosphoribosylglycinamide synthetase C domain-containing protein [Parcubacteria group bacterium]|jgi:phosphoribosylamine--glycine ligase
MRVLFVSGELIAADLCLRLQQEGCEVKLYIEDEGRRDCLDGMIEKVTDWEKELDWVGKNGLIVFDDIGYGKIQDDLRSEGYNVVGGSLGGDKLEKEREFGQVVFSTYGLNALKTINFTKISEAVNFIKKNPCAWVIKQNGHISALNYVGQWSDGSDAISILESYRRLNGNLGTISLQKRVDGVEIGVGRYFNGKEWIGPIELNIEHKHLCNGSIGPMTGEMGTVMWYTENEKNRLFQGTLAKLKPFLEKVNFKGDIDINCIVDKKHIYPLEATARFGCPAIQLQTEIHKSPWKDFLLAVAKGEKYDLKYKKGFGVVVSIAIPPFPYKSISTDYHDKGVKIFFKEKLSKKELASLHFEEVSLKKTNCTEDLCVAGSNGFIMYVSGFGKNAKSARHQAYELVKKINIPKMFYRDDIGERFVKKDMKTLREWNWI